ncbi:hypothetical protein ACWKX9_25315 [Enterobacter asburiae]|uniref:hypothetical protein n=1 Tax=Enterobacter bugandensis TaxID=881260 RepID=UPI00200339A0|nr:hypothetical protein [Enterobacter bugandensis]MCK6879974.1 hypothetical protein [Enterobacter bugandensis]
MLLLIRKNMLIICTLLLAFKSMAAMEGAEINFNSSCDFKELTMNIIEAQNINPNLISLNITLQPAASTRLMKATRNHMNQILTMHINGLKINTATVRSEVNGGTFRVTVDKKTAQDLFTGLLKTECLQ